MLPTDCPLKTAFTTPLSCEACDLRAACEANECEVFRKGGDRCPGDVHSCQECEDRERTIASVTATPEELLNVPPIPPGYINPAKYHPPEETIQIAHSVEFFRFPEPQSLPASAPELLKSAVECIGDRAASRDQPSGERSMLRTVQTFNALTGSKLSERDGWMFMVCLKAARSYGGKYHRDDYVDGAAYFALAGEGKQP